MIKKDRRIFEETFIRDLIEGNINDKTLTESTMENLYMNLKTDLYLAVVDIVQYKNTLTNSSYLRDLFEGLQNEFKYFIYLNNIVIIISTDNKMLNIKRDLKNLHEFFMKYKIFAGISSSFQNLFELQKHYKQALNALNYGLNIYSDQRIFKYDEFRVDCFLNSVKDSTNVSDLCNPVVFLMKEYDKENNTLYYDIIFSYLLAGRSSQLTSEKMKMDHDELCGHLEKIEEIFEIDWNNGNMLLSIFISIKILECLTY